MAEGCPGCAEHVERGHALATECMALRLERDELSDLYERLRVAADRERVGLMRMVDRLSWWAYQWHSMASVLWGERDELRHKLEASQAECEATRMRALRAERAARANWGSAR